jgi:hypothetical protein
MRPPRALAAVAMVLVAQSWTDAVRAQPQAATVPLAAPVKDSAAASPSLRDRIGVDDAARLLRSNDPEERLRGVEQAANLHTVEALSVLERAAGTDSSRGLDPRLPAEGIARTDPRAVLAVVRALAGWTEREDARAALASLVSAPNESFAFRVGALPDHDDGRGAAIDAGRILLARREAAIALAESGSSLAIEALIAIGRGAGPGRDAALDALAVHPPSAPGALAGVVLTTPAMIALAVDVGDLRTPDAALGAVRASDPALRAAAIEALGASADTRVIDAARAAVREEPAEGNAAVRIAAARALVRLGASDAAEAVAGLVGTDATAEGGLALAGDIQDENVTRAAVARAAAATDPTLRTAAIAVLGRQASPAAIRALAGLVEDPRVSSDALAAIARSPNSAALAAIEALDDRSTNASAAVNRRLAARAYFVRRFTRGERSARLDALLGSLAGSPDARNRSVGIEALVALRERDVESGLADPDARVRTAAALGAVALDDPASDERLLDRMPQEPDDRVRRVLAFGWTGAKVDRSGVSTTALVERAAAGGTDAAMATLALGQRAAEPRASKALDTLLGSPDPVIRAHAARGLGETTSPDAAERLARAYAWEGDASVRRAIVRALAQRTSDGSAARARTLALAARLDPDRGARWTAEQGLRGRSLTTSQPPREVLWVRLIAADGAASPEGAEAVFVCSSGDAVPIAFDSEGYALVPGVPPGEGKLRLAPGAQSYSAREP